MLPKFAHPEFFPLLWVCGGLVLLWLVAVVLRVTSRPNRTRFSKFSILGEAKVTFFGILFLAGLALALAQPQQVVNLPEENKLNFFILVDHSFSGLATDIEPTRFGRIKAEVKKFVKTYVRPGDRVGLAVIGGGVVIKSYLMEDPHDFFIKLADMEINTDDSDTWNTDLLFGLKTVTDVFEKQSQHDKDISGHLTRTVFLLFSDGDDKDFKNADSDKKLLWDDTVKKLHKLDISVYTLGVGTLQGQWVEFVIKNSPSRSSGDWRDYYEDEEGGPISEPQQDQQDGKSQPTRIFTELREKTLKDIATETDGYYFAIARSSVKTDNFFQNILNKERHYGVKEDKSQEQDLSHYVLLGCVGILALIIILF